MICDVRFALKKLEQCEKVKEKFYTTIQDKVFVIHPNVFNPDIFVSPNIFASYWIELIKESKPKRVLEIGTGAGYNAVLAILNGAEHVTCTDIANSACENAKENVEKYHLEKHIRVLQGDVFDPLSETEKFDLIYWNFPFGHTDKSVDELNVLERMVFDPGYTSIDKFLRSVGQHLQPHTGRVYLGFSPTLGCFDELINIASKYNWQFQIYYKETTITETNQDKLSLRIYELVKLE